MEKLHGRWYVLFFEFPFDFYVFCIDDVDKYVRATACDNSVLDDNLKLLPQKKTRAGKSVYSQSIYTKAEKRIISAHQSMLAIANEIHVSKPVVLESLDMYKEYSKLSNNYHGSELDTICAALMYICCRKQNVCRSPKK